MKILALESSGLVAGIAIAEDGNLVGEYTLNHKKTHSQTLIPMLDELAGMIELDMRELDYIATSGGPGSFTGLRIGSATAKGLALSLDIPVVAVPTLEGLSYNLMGAGAYVCPIMDARRNQVYTGAYCYENGNLISVIEQAAMSIEDLTDKLNEIGRKVIFLGDGVKVFREYIDEHLKNEHGYAPVHMRAQKAASVAARGMDKFLSGEIVDSAEFNLEYLRLSQAERERLARGESI